MTNNDMPLPIIEQERLLESIRVLPFDKQTEIINQNIQSGNLDTLPRLNHRRALKEFITTDTNMLKVKERAVTLSQRNESVLVLGESGTGKELIARILHGERRGEFVAVNVCAVTDTLFESELFGHERGSFTGADRERAGLIETAKGGTLFLDEIGDMPLHLQPKVLRMIQHRTYRRVGSNVDRPVECRIIAATHRDLRSMILKDKFRLDLYERLNVFALRLTPLRERAKDIINYVPEQLAYHVADMLQNMGMKKEYMHHLLLSGNVRQLLNLKLRWEVFGDMPMAEDLL